MVPADEATGVVESGVVKPTIDRTYPLDDIVSALRYVDEGRARGKVVLTMDRSDSAASVRSA